MYQLVFGTYVLLKNKLTMIILNALSYFETDKIKAIFFTWDTIRMIKWNEWLEWNEW